MADAEKLLWQILAIFVIAILPSALIATFPLWLGLRRGRPTARSAV